MKKVCLLSLLFLGISSLAGCNKTKNFEIKFKDDIPNAVLYENFDFEPYIIKEEGVSYSLKCYYQDYTLKEEKEIPTVGLTFIPETSFDVSIVVTGQKGSLTKQRKTLLRVSTNGKGTYDIKAYYSITLPDYDNSKPAFLEYDVEIDPEAADKYWVRLEDEDGNYFGPYRFTRAGIDDSYDNEGVAVISNEDGVMHLAFGINDLISATVARPKKLVRMCDHNGYCSGAQGTIKNITIGHEDHRPPVEPIPEGMYRLRGNYSAPLPDYDEAEEKIYLEMDLTISPEGTDKYWAKLVDEEGSYFGNYRITTNGITTDQNTKGIFITSNDGNGNLHVVFALHRLVGGSPTIPEKLVKIQDVNNWTSGAVGFVGHFSFTYETPEGVEDEKETVPGRIDLEANYQTALPEYDETKEEIWFELDLYISDTGANKFWAKLQDSAGNFFGPYRLTRGGIDGNYNVAGIYATSDMEGNLHIVFALHELSGGEGTPGKLVSIADYRGWTSGAEGYFENLSITYANPTL